MGGRLAGGPSAAGWGRGWVAQGPECAAARSLSGLPNLAGFCRDSGGIRDKASNSGSYTPLAPRVNHITNVGLRGQIPAPEENNWSTPMADPFNNYRNNAQGASNFCAPDLVLNGLRFDPAVCVERLDVSVDVINQGCLGVGPGVGVSFFSEGMGSLGQAHTAGSLVAGATERVSLSVPGNFVAATVWAVVDDDGSGLGVLNECEENNSLAKTQVCVPPG